MKCISITVQHYVCEGVTYLDSASGSDLLSPH